MFLCHPPTSKGVFEPPQGTITSRGARDQPRKVLADRGEEVVHALEGLQYRKLPHRGDKLQVPGCSRETILPLVCHA